MLALPADAAALVLHASRRDPELRATALFLLEAPCIAATRVAVPAESPAPPSTLPWALPRRRGTRASTRGARAPPPTREGSETIWVASFAVFTERTPAPPPRPPTPSPPPFAHPCAKVGLPPPRPPSGSKAALSHAPAGDNGVAPRHGRERADLARTAAGHNEGCQLRMGLVDFLGELADGFPVDARRDLDDHTCVIAAPRPHFSTTTTSAAAPAAAAPFAFSAAANPSRHSQETPQLRLQSCRSNMSRHRSLLLTPSALLQTASPASSSASQAANNSSPTRAASAAFPFVTASTLHPLATAPPPSRVITNRFASPEAKECVPPHNSMDAARHFSLVGSFRTSSNVSSPNPTATTSRPVRVLSPKTALSDSIFMASSSCTRAL